MIIDGLPTIPSAPTSGDELPIERGTNTYKVDYNALAVAIISKLGGDPVAIAHGGTGATSASAAKTNLGLGNVDNTSDTNKPVSAAQAAALALKLDKVNVYNGLDKTDSGYALDARQGSLVRLLVDEIPNTTQNYTFDANGVITQVTHVSGNTTVRTDVFGFSDTTVTETRTLNSGASLAIATNLSTLRTTVSFADT